MVVELESCRVLVLSASLRDDSLNTRLARLAATTIEDSGHIAERASLREHVVGPYDGDAEQAVGFPPGADDLRRRLEETDAFVIVSPEYNASMPGALKNVIDWVSRFRPQPFHERHGLLLSASPSMIGGNRGLWALRIPLEHLGARIYPDMFSLAQAHTAFDGDHLANERLQERLEATIAGFLNLAEAEKRYPRLKTAWIEFLGERPEPVIDRVE
jgi:chromate reductase, NAD(P)H dehydrogenase (quinone)